MGVRYGFEEFICFRSEGHQVVGGKGMNNKSKGLKDKPHLRADVAGLMSPLLANVYWPATSLPPRPPTAAAFRTTTAVANAERLSTESISTLRHDSSRSSRWRSSVPC